MRLDNITVLFITPYPAEGPSSRYRVEQYIPYLEGNGVRCIVRPFVSRAFYEILYKKRFYMRKILFFLYSSIKRFLDIFLAIKSDIIFIHLEIFPFGPHFFEYFFSKILRKKLIYDLDDAIYMGVTSTANTFIKRLKCPSKIKKIIKISQYVIACNEYLGDYARKYNKNVSILHTIVDTEKFVPEVKKNKEKIAIGWIGSHSTAPYIEGLKGVFSRLGMHYKINLKLIGAGKDIKISGIEVINVEWNLEDEIKELQSLDIGVYPLPDNEWILGKTGFKTIQYMSVGIPCVVSDAGANKIIVKDGINGFLAKTEDEWVQKLSALIEDVTLRERIGFAGRKTAEERFSVKVNAPKFLEIIKKVAETQR